jgi:hypothetical protein
LRFFVATASILVGRLSKSCGASGDVRLSKLLNSPGQSELVEEGSIALPRCVEQFVNMKVEHKCLQHIDPADPQP